MNSEDIKIREEEIRMMAKKIQESGLQFPDIREREWRKSNSNVAKIGNLLVDAENLLFELDEYQMNNDQCYPEFEDMLLKIGELREQYFNFVDEHLEVLDLDKNR